MAINEAIRVTAVMNRAINRSLKTLLQNAFRDLIEATPVRTGWAQSNWLASAGNPSDNPVGSKEGVDYGSQQDSFRTIRQYTPDQGPLVIYNNVPYIGILNDGYSSQAPAGFVEAILDKAIAEVDRSTLR